MFLSKNLIQDIFYFEHTFLQMNIRKIKILTSLALIHNPCESVFVFFLILIIS